MPTILEFQNSVARNSTHEHTNFEEIVTACFLVRFGHERDWIRIVI